MRIALDAMGGDYAPLEIVTGALAAARENPQQEIILVGQQEAIEKCGMDLPQNVQIYPASEVIAMDEHPATAVRRKKDSSIVVATRLVKEGNADAIVSAGSTGAQMAAALFGLGRIRGIERPAIATVLPTSQGGKLVLDVGANADAKPEHLVQYGVMGSIYAENILHINNPKVAVLNIGSEETKGNELVQAAYVLLKEAPCNFIGNIEGREVPHGVADVIVCDGFVGNVILKFAEGLAGTLFDMIKKEIMATNLRKLGGALIKPGMKQIAKALDYAEYGGSPLLGVNGVSIVCHGSSKAKAIKNAIRVAGECVDSRYIDVIKSKL